MQDSNNESKKPNHRPSLYSDNLADEICLRIATSSDGIHKIAKEFNICAWTIFNWKHEHNYFSNNYTRAKELQAEFLKEQIISIADDSSGDEEVTEYGVRLNREFVERSKLKVNTRQWLMGRLAPKEYGDKKQEEDTPKEITIRVIED